jgi:hypothetical protein
LSQLEDKLLFLRLYHKTNPRHTMHGVPCDLSQPQTHSWMHRLFPVLQRACAALGVAPERDASRGATSPLALAGAPDGGRDGPERRRQRPTAAAQQKEQDSGKKKTPTDKNRLLVNEHTPKVISRGPTVAGTMHAQQAAAGAPLGSPTHATLGQNTGVQGSEPARGLPRQPKNPTGQEGSGKDSCRHPRISSARVVVETVLAGVTRGRMVPEV